MSLKEELVNICHKVYEKGFLAAFDGNLSVRIDENKILITRSGVNKGNVCLDDILTIDNEGKLIEGSGKVTTEAKLHLKVYNNRRDINSVIHCHPVYATAIATSRKEFPNNIFPEVILTLGKVPICKYATPSTDGLADSLDPFVNYANVFLLSNHGAVAVGETLESAYFRMEKLEQVSKTLIVAESIGNLKTLSNEEINELYSIAEETYGIKIDEKKKVSK
jgi:L-fuculose-phosphate aldolase